jgi:NAD(P)-dependent dehydrogenase (short-subunit alcohol dehydrogenase family)
MRFRDRVVVVTGGGSGIGEALALEAGTQGASHVCVIDRDAANAERVAAAYDGAAFGIDVRDERALRDAVRDTENAHGPIALFCSNAGVLGDGGVEEPTERIEQLWETHVMAHIYAARAVLPSMIRNGGGYLLQTGSAAGLLAQLGSLGYTITKAAANSMAEWLAITHHHQGIRVSLLCPQAVRTNIVANSGLQIDAELAARSADATDWKEPSEVAQLCFEAMAEERFLILPQPVVSMQVQRKATDIERWLNGMRRLQALAYQGFPLPGDKLVPLD